MKALVIAGGVPQVELINQLKARGITTVLADGSPNAVARPYADIFYHVDIFDVPAVKAIAEKEKVDFLLTVCADQVLLVVAEVSEMLGLPCYIDFDTAKNVSDKIRMKRIFKEIGIPSTAYVETDHLDPEAISALRYPLVVKPVDAYSSKGVRKAENEEELKRYYEEARQISRSGGVIVEEFFRGEEISVDAFVVDGKARILAVTNSEKVCDADRFVIFRGRYPAAASDVLLQKIADIAQKIADGFGLVNSPLLIQLLNNGDDISVLEFCARTGGNMKWLLIKYSCGVDVITATIDITLGLKPDLTRKDTGHAIVVNDFIYCHPGVFDHFEGFDEMVAQGLINEFHPVRIRGTEMHGVTSSSDRIAGMNIVADSVEEFNEKEKTILQHVKVIDAEGRDIMRRELLPPLQ
ncbi:MAG: ATP-grasp domain-containing protein [Lachnospiraceae bacterium]|nr:ATP-grasp domain-containing protein [Lachnospiraceae bacterium]